ncbi:MAG: PilZ domain-containing protein [Deltaproteobacteria bacterium]|nr:PilZ domain-containing protein [Deltaproteobacteria bacterium]
MSAQDQSSKKYNIVISKLFQIVIDLTEDQQLALLRHAEDLFVKEKRVNIRKSCDIPVNYATDYRVYSNHIKNISQSGLFIETQRPLIVGDEIIMKFRLDGFNKPLKIRGEIAHTNRKGVGVEFKDVSAYIEEMIDILIRRMK